MADVTLARVPYALLALYFLHSFFQTFPVTAYGEWLFQVLHMAPATTTIYYSVGFFPWNLKPLYGLISDNFPIAGYNRKSYIIICEIGAALSLFVTGAYVSTIPAAFIIRVLDAVFEAFSQIMLGIILVDLVAGDTTSRSSAKVQSWSNGAKNIASIIALVIGVPLYKDKSIAPQSIISFTAVFPLLSAVVCAVGINEVRRGARATAEPMVEPNHRISPARTGCKAFVAALGKGWTGFKHDLKTKLAIMKPVLPTMIFFCLCSALPSDGTVWYQYTYTLLADQLECLQYSSLSGMVGRFVSCIMYAKVCSGRNVRHVFLASTISSVLAGLPRLLLTPPMAELPISVCAFQNVESFITSFTAEFALLQLLVVATYYCPENREVQGLTYALYLSFMDFGGVLSGILSSIAVTALGIVPDPVTQLVNWDHLGLLVVLSACCQLLVLAFLYVLPEKVHTGATKTTGSSTGGDLAAERAPLLGDNNITTVV